MWLVPTMEPSATTECIEGDVGMAKKISADALYNIAKEAGIEIQINAMWVRVNTIRDGWTNMRRVYAYTYLHYHARRKHKK